MTGPATLMMLSRAVSIEKAAAWRVGGEPRRAHDLGYALELRGRAGQDADLAERTQTQVVAAVEREVAR